MLTMYNCMSDGAVYFCGGLLKINYGSSGFEMSFIHLFYIYQPLLIISLRYHENIIEV